jgi:membrane peptidoglycan carboxypeptidase
MDKLRRRLGSAVRQLTNTFAGITANRRRNGYVALALIAGMIAWFAVSILKGLPDDEAVRGLANGTPGTRLLDVNGEEFGRIVRERRIEVPLAQVSPHVVRAVLAIEDQRFLEHPGVDVVRIAGAFLKNLRVGRVAEGGSTITQQLARQSFLTPERRFRRKVREALVATRIERQFSKEQILEFYLNKVYFGDGLYGIETAALGYFGKHAGELDVGEAALLAGLLKSPSTCAPTVDLDCALERRSVVLRAMRDTGAIDEAAETEANAAAPRLQDERTAVRRILQGRTPAAAPGAVRARACVSGQSDRSHDARQGPPAGRRDGGSGFPAGDRVAHRWTPRSRAGRSAAGGARLR